MLHIGQESQVQHLVGFVKHDCGDSIEREFPLPDQIEGPPRSGNYDFHSTLDRADLLDITGTAINRHHFDFDRLTVRFHGLCDLNRKLASRSQNQNSHSGLVRWNGAKSVQDRERKSGGLTCTSSRKTDQIFTFEKYGNRLSLNRGRVFISESIHQAWVKTHHRETGNFFYGLGHLLVPSPGEQSRLIG